jgi:hypothetical protein
MNARIRCESKGWGGDSSKAPVTVRLIRARLRCDSQSRADGIELINGEQVEQGGAGDELSAA